MLRFVKVARGMVRYPSDVVVSRPMPNRLRELRAHRQAEAADAGEWNQVKVAEKIGTTEQTYRAWETGRRRPALYNQIRLAELFGVDRVELGFE